MVKQSQSVAKLTKFMGVVIDDKLSFFLFQVDHLSNKLARVVGIHRMLSGISPPAALRSLCFVLL